MFTVAAVVGFLTVTLSVLIKVIGFPDQIRRNHIRKSTEGLSPLLYILSFLAYSLWTLHGFLQNDWVVILGNVLGIVTTGVIVYQIFLYRSKRE